MAAVKFHEGTKFPTSLDLEDGEEIIWVRPEKNAMGTYIADEGCLKTLLIFATFGIYAIFKPSKAWANNLVITTKRVVSIPIPPNKKKWPVESYYYKDITSVKPEAVGQKQSDRMQNAAMVLNFNPNSEYKHPRKITISMERNLKNTLKVLGQGAIEGLNDLGNQLGQVNATWQTQNNKAHAETWGASHYKEVTFKAQKLTQSGTDIEGFRDAIIEIIYDCIEASKK